MIHLTSYLILIFSLNLNAWADLNPYLVRPGDFAQCGDTIALVLFTGDIGTAADGPRMVWLEGLSAPVRMAGCSRVGHRQTPQMNPRKQMDAKKMSAEVRLPAGVQTLEDPAPPQATD